MTGKPTEESPPEDAVTLVLSSGVVMRIPLGKPRPADPAPTEPLLEKELAP